VCGGGTSGTLDLNLLIEVRQEAFLQGTVSESYSSKAFPVRLHYCLF